MTRSSRSRFGLFAFGVVFHLNLAAQSPDWPAYGRDRGGERFSPLKGIDRKNVARLAVAWEYSTGEATIPIQQSVSLEATPLVLGGVMYFSTPLGRVVALDPESGKERWVTDLEVKPVALARCELQRRPRAKARSGPPGAHVLADLEHGQVAVEEHDVDRKAHEPRVNRPGRLDQEAVPARQSLARE